MKRLLSIQLFCLFTSLYTFGQDHHSQPSNQERPRHYIRENVTLHFTSPEPIQFVDISHSGLVGDLPVENVFRIKLKDDFQEANPENLGVVTIIGQKFIAQYDLEYAAPSQKIQTLVEVLPGDMRPLDVGAVPLTADELRQHALTAYAKKEKNQKWAKAENGIVGRINHIHVLDDYIVIDLTFANTSNLKFDTDHIRFRIEDKKIVKATNVQVLPLSPEFQLHGHASFKKKFRNIYIFKKFSFPNNKVFTIELTEKQVSGRGLTLQVEYGELLKADTL